MDFADVFRALGDPVRLKIVTMLAEKGELCVCEIVEGLSMAQPAISHHLTKLKYVGLVKPKKLGQWIFYSLNYEILDESVIPFISELSTNAKLSGDRKQSCCGVQGDKVQD